MSAVSLHYGEHFFTKFFYEGSLEDGLGYGKPSENPYVSDSLSSRLDPTPAPAVCS